MADAASKKSQVTSRLISFISRNLALVEIYTLVLYPIVLAIFGLFREFPMMIAVALLTLIQAIFIVFKLFVSKDLSKLKDLIDQLKKERRLMDKERELLDHERLLEGKESEISSLRSLMKLVQHIEQEITKLKRMKDIDGRRLADLVGHRIMEVVFHGSKIFGIDDNDSTLFRISVYHWSESELVLIPAFCCFPEGIKPTYRRWERFQGNTGNAFGYKKCSTVENLAVNETLKATVPNRPAIWDRYYRSLISCPIMIDDEDPIGAITLSCNREGHFKSREEETGELCRTYNQELSVISSLFYGILDFAKKNQIPLPELSPPSAESE